MSAEKVFLRSIPLRNGLGHTCKTLLVITLLFLGAVRVAAQNSSANGIPAESKTGQSTISTYARDKIETVNLANGNFTMSIPLATVGGRGSAAFTIALTYNSKVWTSQLDREAVYTEQGAIGTPRNHYSAMYEKVVDFDHYLTKLGGGWTILASPGMKGKLIGIDRVPTTACNSDTDGIPDCGFWYALTKMWLTLPDGSQVELRDSLTEGAPSLNTQIVNGYHMLVDRDRGRVWHSFDGSNITFVRDLNDPPQAETFYPSGWVFLADGTRLRMDFGSCWKIIDRNGNFITLSGGTYTDQLGRQTLLQVTENTATVTVKGYLGLPDKVISIDLSALGNPENLRTDFQSLPRPFTTGDAMYDALGNYLPHTIQGAHTDLFIESEGVMAYGTTAGDDVGLRKAVTRLNLPDGRSMRFRYNQYGEVAEIVYPSGGISQVDYAGGTTTICEVSAPIGMTLNRRVSQRRSLTNGLDVDATWIYSQGGEVIDGITRPTRSLETRQGSATGPLLSAEKHIFLALNSEYRTCQPSSLTGTGNEKWENNKEFLTEIQTGTGTIITRRQWQQRAPLVWGNDVGLSYNHYAVNRGQDQAPNDPRVEWEETTLENGKTKRVEYGYDNFNNITSIKEYDFGTPGSPGTLLRQTVRQYAGNAPTTSINSYCYTNLNPLDSSCGSGLASDPTKIIHQKHILLSETIKDGNGNQKAFTEFEYDNYSSDTNHAALVINSGMIQHDAGQFSIFASSSHPRGNVTKTTRWAGASSYIHAFAQYNNAGSVIWSKDANGNVSTVSYADNFGAGNNPDAGSAGPFGLTYAMATLATNALGHQTKIQFDYTRGVPTGVKDPNGVVTKTEYDLLGRPTRNIVALDLVEQTIAETTYPTSNANFTTVSQQLDATRWLASKNSINGFDQVVTSWQAEDGQHANFAAYTIRTDTSYDGLGRVIAVSFPYRPASEVAQYTTTTYDVGGRVLTVRTPDNAMVSTSYNGNSVTVTDQAGKSRKSVTDALGRLIEVYEDPNGLNYQTTYSYDTLDNLVKVTQGSQQRFFMYDSLKRLIRARNPEQGTHTSLNLSDPVTGNGAWSFGYQYDSNSNLTQKTDARGIVSTFAYDALNRNTTIDYSDTSALIPDVTRVYDGAVRGKGRLWKSYAGGTESNGSNVERTVFDSYDALNRALVLNQSFKVNNVWKPSYQTTRAYNLAGAVTSQIYPSGHFVTYNYDNAGRLADKDVNNLAFTGNLGDGTPRTYSRGISYASAGQLKQEQFGTATAVYNKLFYNSRQQLAEILVSTTAGSTWDRGKILNQYSLQCSGASCNATDNNGNLRKQEVFIPNTNPQLPATSWYQQYDYDELNRLKRVHEYTGNTTVDWQQEFDYDRWGNRTINAAQTWGTGINNKQFTVDANTNRLGVPSGQSGAMSYDSAGNLITDTYTGAGARNYDAENRMTQAWGGNNQWQYYTYNADGQRTRRKINGQETWQVYGLGGELLAEYPADGAANNPTKEYGYRNGQLLVTAEPPRTNVALAANGATASASSQVSTNYPAYSTINGDRRGLNWNNGGGWNDGTVNTHPDWLQIDFNGSKTIDEINVITLQDNPATPAEPTESMTFTLYGLTGYSVQYWNGSAWTSVPGGTVSGNNKVWRKFTFPAITTTKIRVLTSSSPDAYSRITEVEAWGNEPAPARTNFALGGLTSASSTISANYPTFSTINGDRRGLNWNFGGGWNDATVNTHPDWLQIDFNGSKTIDEINVFTLQDTPATPAEPTETMTFSLYGLTAYDVQYWNNSTWVTIPSGSVTGNNKVWRKFTFSPITTSKIRVLTNAALEHYSRITEVEAYGPTEPSASAGIKWVVPDHLGTPRIMIDQTGNLSDVKRHDYLPFGEELFTGTGVRTVAMGYTSDGVRQQFTSKERDVETGLDYFGARYYGSVQGRFTGVDLAGPDFTKPQTLNKYQYCLNNPMKYIDSQGLYEEDVHRDLTFALALAAGFNTHSAQAIAAANQYTDDNPATSPMGMTPWGDNVKKRELYHFTTESRRNELWSSFEGSGSLQDLGTFFHAQQDSFSHETYGARWGHASAGHAPDKTYNNPGKADTMAYDTFSRMTTAVTLLVKNGKETISYAAVDYKTIAPMAQEFNRATTAQEKKKIINQIVTEVQRQHYEQDRAKEEARKKKEEPRKKKGRD